MAKVKVTKNLFDSVKLMLAAGVSGADCARIMNVSTFTVSFIKNSGTFEDYKKKMADRETEKREKREAKKEKEKKPDPPAVDGVKMSGGTLSSNYIQLKTMEYQKQIAELLTLISRKLAFIVEELGCDKEGNET